MFGTLGIFERYFRSEAGSTIVLAALVFPLVIGMTGVGIDVGNWLMTKRHAQTEADAAALAGAWEILNGGTQASARAAAEKEAENNGYDPGAGGDIDVAFDTDADGYATVAVTIIEKSPVWFSSIFIEEPIDVSVTATGGLQSTGPYCILSLHETASGAITMSGTATIDTPTCGAAVNSSAADAWKMSGTVNVNMGAVTINGDYTTTGSVSFEHTSLKTNTGMRLPDPYASLEVPPHTACTNAQQKAGPLKITSSTTLSPGTYCGGITMSSSAHVTMPAGTYIMDGGGFSSSGSVVIDASAGVTIIFTNSGGSSYGNYGVFDVSGSGSITLTAPTTGDYAGVAIYVDRAAPSHANRISGSSGVTVTGVLYAPTQTITYTGTSSGETSTCTQIVSDKLILNGTSEFGGDCTGKGVKSLGITPARLIL